jgi:hypothetical protein
MDEALFWSLIPRLDWDQSGDDAVVMRALIRVPACGKRNASGRRDG